MLIKINNWLENRERKYADGLAIFMAAASYDIRKKYADFFKSAPENPDQFSPHFSMLINKVSDIERKVRFNPELFKDVKLIEKLDSDSGDIAAKEAQICELSEKIAKLEEAHSSELEDKDGELLGKDEELSNAIEEMEELKTELEALKTKRGISIVQYSDLPSEIKALYDRVKVITPLMASLHADMSVEKLHPSTRKKIVGQLTELDDQRRASWDTIDEWSEGKLVEPKEEKVLAYSDDKLLAGAQMARRLERVKENITRTQATIDSSERGVIKENAEKRLADYIAELCTLEALLLPVETKEGDVE